MITNSVAVLLQAVLLYFSNAIVVTPKLLLSQVFLLCVNVECASIVAIQIHACIAYEEFFVIATFFDNK